MPKMKTLSGAKKRFKQRANSLKRKTSHMRHILTKMSSKRKRQLRGKQSVHKSEVRLVERMLAKR